MDESYEEDQDLNELGPSELFEPFQFENYLGSDSKYNRSFSASPN